jgi:hypothetical protein
MEQHGFPDFLIIRDYKWEKFPESVCGREAVQNMATKITLVHF